MSYGGSAAIQDFQWPRYGVDYGPTNGTVSIGDLVRSGGGPANFGLLPQIDRIQKRYNVSSD